MNRKKTIYILIFVAVFALQITAVDASTVTKTAETGWINTSESGSENTGSIRTSSISNLGIYARGGVWGNDQGVAWIFIDMKLGSDSFYLTTGVGKYYQFKVSWTWNGYYQEGPGDSYFNFNILVMDYDEGTTYNDYAYDHEMLYTYEISAGSWSTSSVYHTLNFAPSSNGYYRIVLLVETSQDNGLPWSTRRTQFKDSGYYLDLNYISATDKYYT